MVKKGSKSKRCFAYLLIVCFITVQVAFLKPLKALAVSSSVIVKNSDFEADFSTDSGNLDWVVDSTPSTGVVSRNTGWDHTKGSGGRLNYWNSSEYTADTYQSVKDVPNGTYTLKAYTASGGTHINSYMYADNGTNKVTQQITTSGSFVEISLDVEVTNGQLKIGFYDNGAAGAWSGVDDVTLTKVVTTPKTTTVKNSDFETAFSTDISNLDWVSETSPSTGVASRNTGWDHTTGSGEALGYWNSSEFTADTYQRMTGLDNGAYTLSAWIANTGTHIENYMYADNGTNNVKKNVTSGSAFTQVNLEVNVVNGELKIGFYDHGAAGAWTGVDDVTLVKQGSFELDPNGVNISNRSFEVASPSDTIDSWSEEGDTSASYTVDAGYQSSYTLKHSKDSDYKVRTYQSVENLEDGYYTLSAWTKSSGGQNKCYLFAKDNGTSESRTTLPVSDDWTLVTIRGIHVTNGRCTIGLYSDANENNWADMDIVQLVKNSTTPKDFLRGGDITELIYLEDNGAKFYDDNGVEKDCLQILKEKGMNTVRIRLYNNPGKGKGDGTDYLPDGYQDEDDVLTLAKRAKEKGMKIELTFHYSDYWSNGGIQNIPADWKPQIAGMNDTDAVNKLEDLVHDYTYDIMAKMAAQGTTPEYVSLGNEMQAGILFPYGKALNTKWANLAKFLNAGYAAVKEVSTNSKIILHLDDAGNYSKYRGFLDNCASNNINYDIIGASYYPYWTNRTINSVVSFCNTITSEYDKDIIIMETGYDFNPTLPNGKVGQLKDNGPYNTKYPPTPQGQKAFLTDLFNGLKSVDGGRCIGDLYWDPIMIEAKGVGWAINEATDKPEENIISNTTLFDFEGKALPALDAYSDNANGVTTGIVEGKVNGSDGKFMPNADVTLNLNSVDYKVKTDKFGNYMIIDVPEGTNGTITATKAGYESGTIVDITVKAGDLLEDKDIEIIGGSISGKIIDDSSNNLEGVTVKVIAGGREFTTKTASDGIYTLSDIPQGTKYEVFATKVGFVDNSIRNIEVSTGNVTPDVNMILRLDSGTISGYVQDDLSAKVADAQVSLIVGSRTYEVKTNSEGNFTMPYVTVGSGYTVVAVKEDYLDGSKYNVTVNKAQTTSGVAITMVRNIGNISGKVLGSDETAIAGVTVVAKSGTKTYSTTTNETGEFSFNNVLAGIDYTLTASKDNYIDGTISDVKVTLGETNSGVTVRIMTIIAIVNGNFETTPEDNNLMPGWTVDASNGSTTRQYRPDFGDDGIEGPYALSTWDDTPYTSDVYQTVTGLANGRYTLSAWIYNGGNQNKCYMYAEDFGGDNVKLDLPMTSATGWMKVSLNANVTNNKIKIGFYQDANDGNWLVVDAVKLGYSGVLTADEVANSISKVDNPLQDGKKLTLPSVPDGFKIKIKTSNSSVLATDGAITPPDSEINVSLIFEVERISDGKKSLTDVVRVKVPAKTQLSFIPIIASTQSSTQTATATVTATPTPTDSGVETVKPSNIKVFEAKPALDEKTGSAVVSVAEKVLNDILDSVKDSINGDKKVAIQVEKVKGANDYSVELPKSLLTGDEKNSFELISEFGNVTMSGDMLKSNDLTDSKNVSINIGNIDTKGLEKKIKEKLSNKPIIELSLKSGDKIISWSNPNSKVVVNIPYTPTEDELKDPEHIVIWYIDGAGNIVTVPSGRYDDKTKSVTFSTTHFSKYAVSYVKKSFEDIQEVPWAVKPIEILASKGVIVGASETKFEPTNMITRGEFIAWLVNTWELTADVTDNFSDIGKDYKYYNQLAIAKKLGLAKGYINNQFKSNDFISREDMMVLSVRAMKLVTKISDGNFDNIQSFKDASKVSKYAENDVATMVKLGLIKGSSNMVNPKDKTTKAETATMLYRLYNFANISPTS